MEGSVQVESEIGKGSHFTVVLPLNQDLVEKNLKDGHTQLANASQDFTLASDISRKHTVVLLAEDNQASSEMIHSYLDAHGYTILLAQHGEELLEQVEKSGPDIIVMGIQMPKMDGLETMQRLRRHSRFAATPIIVLTALVMPGDRERCLEAGANEYLGKPVSLKTRSSVIEKLIEAGS